MSLIVDSGRQRGAHAEPLSSSIFRGRERGGRDDWQIETRSLLQALPKRRFERALQVGGTSGTLAEQLAPSCEQLVVLDGFSEQAPAGAWDLVVCAETLSRLDVEALLRATHWLSRQLTAGASVLVASADADAHHLLIHRLACWHAFGQTCDGVRVDRFDGDRA